MKKFFKVIGILIAIAILVALGYLLVRKIKTDTIAQRDLQIEANNIQAEAEFLCDRATKKLTTLIDEIETSLKVNIEVADIGGLNENDIYFVTPVGTNYMYITKTKVEDKDTFALNCRDPVRKDRPSRSRTASFWSAKLRSTFRYSPSLCIPVPDPIRPFAAWRT